MHTVRAHRALAYGSDYLDTLHIEIRLDIGVETSCANIGVLAHINNERLAMIALLKLDSITRHLYASLPMIAIYSSQRDKAINELP